MKLPKYRIYPSLLDKFEALLHVEEEVESPFNLDAETGEYKRTEEEIEFELKKSLIDAINRVPFDSEAADRGTAFNAIIDSYIHRRPHKVATEREPYEIRGFADANIVQVAFEERNNGVQPGRHFCFDRQWCIEQAEYFTDCISQVLVKAVLPTRYGDVELYGYIDELRRDTVYDIKTTSRYQFGKYERGWQRHVYPYCLIASGMMSDVKAFEYTAYQLKDGTSRTPLISGTRYPEYYVYDHAQSTAMLTAHCEAFIEFLEANRELITDKKIFGNTEE